MVGDTSKEATERRNCISNYVLLHLVYKVTHLLVGTYPFDLLGSTLQLQCP